MIRTTRRHTETSQSGEQRAASGVEKHVLRNVAEICSVARSFLPRRTQNASLYRARYHSSRMRIMTLNANRSRLILWLVCWLCISASGCSLWNSLQGVSAIPAHRVPPEFLAQPRSHMQELSMSRLRQDPPEAYRLGPGDILGIYIATVMGNPEEPPPVQFSDDGSQPPSVGYPVPVREDGTISLPLVPPLKVLGLTLIETTEAIRNAYTVDQQILCAGKDRIIATLMQRRRVRVLVVREETGGLEGVTKRGTGHIVELPAYENDLLHALNATGGLPGLDAENEVQIFHGLFQDGVERDRRLSRMNTVLSQLDTTGHSELLDRRTSAESNVIRIPLRFEPGHAPEFKQEDIVLRTGDIVLIRARDREKFYTGGALPGGEHLLPRDYDLDVLGAIALAGGLVGNSGIGLAPSGGSSSGNVGGRGTGYSGVAPSQAIVLRKVCGGGQIPIRVDLNRALMDPSQRILIQPEDMIVVRYTLSEEIYNAILNLVQFNFLFNGGGL